MTIGAVLDPYAMLAYARGSESVGELLLMLSEENRQVALPTAALAEAFRQADDGTEAILRILAAHEQTVIVPLDAPDAEPVGMLAKATTMGVAHGVLVVRRTRAYLMTTSAKSVEGLVDGDLIIEI